MAVALQPYYEHAGVTIYHGDCREILSQLPKADLLLTDPPYGIRYAAHPIRSEKRLHEPKTWDDATVDGLYELIRHAGKTLVVWGGNYYALPPSRGWFTWFKPDAPRAEHGEF